MWNVDVDVNYHDNTPFYYSLLLCFLIIHNCNFSCLHPPSLPKPEMSMREGISPGGREYTMYRAFTIQKVFLKLAVHLLMLLVLSRSCCSFNKPKVEGEALIDLLKALNDTNGKVIDWNIDFVSPCDSWSHVTCKNGNVTSLSLASNGFSGTLSPSITKLKYLESLDLHDNNLSGVIPDYLSGMLNLQNLNLGNNKFSGSIPAALGQLSNLKHLVLRENHLSGPIPNSLVNITGLKELDVSSNDLAGGVPVQLFSVPIYNFSRTHLRCGNHFQQPCVSSSSVPVSHGKSKLEIAITGASCGAFVLLLIGAIFVHRSNRLHKLKSEVFVDVEGEDECKIAFGQIRKFSWREIQIATEDFNESNIIGQGGYGKVYKGFLSDNTKVAVKRLADYLVIKNMSFFGDLRHTPAPTKPPGAAAVGGADPRVPLLNLANVQARMESLHQFLSSSVTSNTLLAEEQMGMVSTEIAAAIHQIIVNGAALLASTQAADQVIDHKSSNKRLFSETDFVDQNVDAAEDGGSGGEDWEIVELDAVELLAEHIHFCEICGKGFKRDANLRMHMRAHGNQFKTPEALAKPGKCGGESGGPVRKTRFSCPFVGCSRNKTHKKFRPLKSAICVKNHFRRSHCPKMYSCNRCNKKSFSVLADLKSHAKHCGETKWKCSCGTSFSRKDKLFGHMALFEGHMPAVDDEKAAVPMAAEEEEDEEDSTAKKYANSGGSDNGFLDRLFKDDCDSIDNYCFQEILGWSSPNAANTGLTLENHIYL